MGNEAEDKNQKITAMPVWDGPAVSGMESVGNNLWDFDKLKIPSLWAKYRVKGDNVNAYVIDSGVDNSHHLFAHSPLKSVSFLGNDPDPKDYNGHGTWVCGKIGANGVGIAPKCRLTSLRTLDANGSGYSYYTTDALKWIANQPDPHIVNMSLGSSYNSVAQGEICQELYDRGCLVIAAAGNENTSAYSYPAAYDSVMAVAAIDSGSNRAWFSNYGNHIVVSAPGVSCYSTYLNGTFRKLQGTSMASPTVAGLLTLGASYLLKLNPSMGRATMRDILVKALTNTALDLGASGHDAYYGYGGIQGDKFMAALEKV
jgi:subtilisin family serine protease